MTIIIFLSIDVIMLYVYNVIMSYAVVGFWMDCVPDSERLLNPADLKALDSNSVGSSAVYFVCFVRELVILETV